MTRRQFNSFGFSLLEMVMAAALVTGTVVPALSVIRDSMKQSRNLHRQKLLANYAVRRLDEQAAIVAYGEGDTGAYTNWVDAIANSPEEGDYAADGHANTRFTVTSSDDPADGGLTGQLMNIEVTVYDDANSNDTLDAGESREIYRTKVANLESYENENRQP